MAVTRDQVEQALAQIQVPGGGTLISAEFVRALHIDGETVSFVIEAPNAQAAQALGPVRDQAEAAVKALPGVAKVMAALTAHGPAAPQKPAPSLKIGGHPTAQAGPTKPEGIDKIIVIGSGKGGVGKSTVSSNLAVALAKQGRKVGLLDADIYGPSQQRMMGTTKRAASPDGKVISPLHSHGVTLMSIGMMMDPDKAVIWRGPMLMGALQQMLGQVEWGQLDVLLIDLPPGTGDILLSLCQKTLLDGAIIVSTPQDVALIDARKAIDMFDKLKTPVLGLIENMSVYHCPNCGHEAHIFGHGGVAAEADKLGVPLLAQLPIDLDTRLAGDAGTPIAAGDSSMAQAYAQLAEGLIKGGMA
jgi:ATP-binding protein involved in chromosome partitioning